MIIRTNRPNRPIYISLTNPGEILTINSPVRGKVLIDPRSRPSRVTISFFGRTRACITRRTGSNSLSTYKTKPLFFTYTLELFASESQGESYDILKHGVTVNNRVELPFSFRFPEKTPPKRGVSRVKDKFNHQEGDELPPSFLFTANLGFRVTNGDQQSVEYMLEAKLFVSSPTPEEEVRCRLRFLPPAPANTPDASVLVRTSQSYYMHQPKNGLWIRSYRLLPDWDPEERLRDRIKIGLKSWSNAPYANFKIEARCSCVLTVEQPVRFNLVVEHLRRSEEIPQPPVIYLRRIRVRLQSNIHVCVPAGFSLTSSEYKEMHTYKPVLLDARYDEGDGLLVYDGMEICTKPLLVSAVPAFRTYALGLDHVLEVYIWGECAKEKFEVVPLHGKVFIVPPPTLDFAPNRIEDGEREAVDEEQPVVEEGDGAPPGLDDDIRPPRYQAFNTDT
ncbi:hypothetical protein CC80DRAFT_229896 [Byssothecium circinans]|uniref:Arrestin-like N-terminal domain-containing protein n=1 Tax=Byssothecium circinans TaxID=147558 RepID=A0A6A5U8T9_9PLEO|nr:hypothetical protein CC80DRAFT_229896 [Byssothecium circinans]